MTTYISRHEAAKRLSVSLATIDRMRRQGTIRTYYLGGAVRLDQAQVDGAIVPKREPRPHHHEWDVSLPVDIPVDNQNPQ